MKKLPLVLLLVSALTLGSCASKGWSCSKRYCDTSGKDATKEPPGQHKEANV